MVEPIYKELVIETEAKMGQEYFWLLFGDQELLIKSFKGLNLACIQTEH